MKALELLQKNERTTLSVDELRAMHRYLASIPRPFPSPIFYVRIRDLHPMVRRWLGYRSYPFKRMQRRRHR